MKIKKYIVYEELKYGNIKPVYSSYSLIVAKHQRKRFEQVYKKKYKIMVRLK
jgi:hypothetical protein